MVTMVVKGGIRNASRSVQGLTWKAFFKFYIGV